MIPVMNICGNDVVCCAPVMSAPVAKLPMTFSTRKLWLGNNVVLNFTNPSKKPPPNGESTTSTQPRRLHL
jgi:hypothetical protein